jgi:hypothetical protein
VLGRAGAIPSTGCLGMGSALGYSRGILSWRRHNFGAT